jgi:hypothetical protein
MLSYPDVLPYKPLRGNYMKSPEKFIPYILAPLLSVAIGSLARTGYEIFREGRIFGDVVDQYFDGKGCLANGPYDDTQGERDNIAVRGVAHLGPTIVAINTVAEPTDTMYLQYIGSTDGGLELGPADHISAGVLKLAGCKLPEGA